MPVKRFSPRLLIVIIVVVAVIAIAVYMHQTTIVLDAPQPYLIPGTVDTLPRMPLSIVEAPVTYELDTAIDSLEAAIPRTYGDLGQKIVSAKNKQVVGSSRVDLQACKLEYSIVSPK